jgi:hypothetical protein
VQRTQGVLQTIQEKDVNNLNAACSPLDFNSIRQMLTELSKNFESILQSLERTELLISCEALTPIYRKATSESLCNYNVVFLAWTFSCLVIISICGMTMITLRSSWKFDTTETDKNNVTLSRKSNNAPESSGMAVNIASGEREDSEIWSSEKSNVQAKEQTALESSNGQTSSTSLEDIASNRITWDWDWNKPSLKKEIT